LGPSPGPRTRRGGFPRLRGAGDFFVKERGVLLKGRVGGLEGRVHPPGEEGIVPVVEGEPVRQDLPKPVDGFAGFGAGLFSGPGGARRLPPCFDVPPGGLDPPAEVVDGGGRFDRVHRVLAPPGPLESHDRLGEGDKGRRLRGLADPAVQLGGFEIEAVLEQEVVDFVFLAHPVEVEQGEGFEPAPAGGLQVLEGFRRLPAGGRCRRIAAFDFITLDDPGHDALGTDHVLEIRKVVGPGAWTSGAETRRRGRERDERQHEKSPGNGPGKMEGRFFDVDHEFLFGETVGWGIGRIRSRADRKKGPGVEPCAEAEAPAPRAAHDGCMITPAETDFSVKPGSEGGL